MKPPRAVPVGSGACSLSNANVKRFARYKRTFRRLKGPRNAGARDSRPTRCCRVASHGFTMARQNFDRRIRRVPVPRVHIYTANHRHRRVFLASIFLIWARKTDASDNDVYIESRHGCDVLAAFRFPVVPLRNDVGFSTCRKLRRRGR